MRYRSRILRYDDIAMLILALVSGVLLILELTVDLSAAQVRLLDTADLFIALTFLCEFILKFLFAKKKMTYLKWHWWDLLAAIPITTPATQALRLLRIIRLVVHLNVARENGLDLQNS